MVVITNATVIDISARNPVNFSRPLASSAFSKIIRLATAINESKAYKSGIIMNAGNFDTA